VNATTAAMNATAAAVNATTAMAATAAIGRRAQRRAAGGNDCGS
jgi:hypothetical protein